MCLLEWVLFLGESITGEDAFRAGLVSRLVEEELIDSEVSYFTSNVIWPWSL